LKNRLPLWAEEGLATTAEGLVMFGDQVRFTPDENPMRLADLREGISGGDWLPLKTLLTTNTKSVAQGSTVSRTVGYYGQLYALMHFLRHDPTYQPRWRRMFQAAREGTFQSVLSAGQLRRHGLRYHQAISLSLFQHYISNDLKRFEAEYTRYARKLVRLPY
jgi:hypothetical protein